MLCTHISLFRSSTLRARSKSGSGVYSQRLIAPFVLWLNSTFQLRWTIRRLVFFESILIFIVRANPYRLFCLTLKFLRFIVIFLDIFQEFLKISFAFGHSACLRYRQTLHILQTKQPKLSAKKCKIFIFEAFII